MCKGFGQTCADEQENTRIQLQIYYERNNHLADVIHASNGLIITILAGVLAFAGLVEDVEGEPFYIALIVAIIIFSLISWRAYAHYVDKDIVGIYGKILCCEYRLNVALRTSLLLSLVRGLPESSKRKELVDLIKSEHFSRAYNEMFLMLEEKRIGDRGHLLLDGIALIFCILSLIVGGFAISPVLPLTENIIIFFVFGLLFGILTALLFFYQYLPVAKNPS